MSSAFVDFLHQSDARNMPDHVLAFGRRWMLDLLGVAAGAIDTRLSRIIRDHAVEYFGPGRRRSVLLFDGRAVSPAGAALAGGMTIDALDAHDGHKLTKGHAGCGVLPALLAVSQAEGMADDRNFLATFILGYEIATRAGMALHRTACDYHTTGAWVAVATAAIAARLLGLASAPTREAIGIAEYHGPRSQMMRCIDHPTMVKDGSGWGAMAGVSAAYLAADGFTGAPAITVEGADVADLWSDLGSNWRIAEQYFKPYPVCRWAQPALQAVLNLRSDHRLTSQDVERIEIVTFHESCRLATRRPQTTEQAQYSTAFPTAVALVRGGVTPVDVMEESFGDPEISRLAEGMMVTESDAFNAAFPARRLARVILVLKDGRRVDSGPTEAIGDPEAPLPLSDVAAKFHAYAGAVMMPERVAEIEEAVAALGDANGTARLFDLVGGPVGTSGGLAA
ncbi:MAG: MmgE/PrpD family protein [Geminicoccaceae bacterium]|nr:MmgE/PrpD family protein [Geminicoccaceae bacterium]